MACSELLRIAVATGLTTQISSGTCPTGAHVPISFAIADDSFAAVHIIERSTLFEWTCFVKSSLRSSTTPRTLIFKSHSAAAASFSFEKFQC